MHNKPAVRAKAGVQKAVQLQGARRSLHFALQVLLCCCLSLKGEATQAKEGTERRIWVQADAADDDT